MKSVVLFIAGRYLRFDPNQPFISISAILAFLGVAVGVMVLIVAMAIMNGFDKEFRERLFVMNYPITVMPNYGHTLDKEILSALETALPHLRFSPFLQTGAVSRYGSLMEGHIVFGVNFEAEKKVNRIFASAVGDREFKPFEAVIGKTLAAKFSVSEGDKLLLIFTRAQPAGLSLFPVIKRFNAGGTFYSGLNAYDKAYIYTRMEDLRSVLQAEPESFDGIHIDADEPFEAIEKVRELLGDRAMAVGWWEQNSNFFSALELEKRALFLVLMLIILVAALNIISSLMMTVFNRRKEIALLISLGAGVKEIEKIFFAIGAVIGIGGIALGSALGALLLWLLANFDIISLPADVYGTSHLPLELSALDFLLTLLGAFIIVIFSSWYPARKAGKTDTLDTLRHE
ncbi:MAG: ABC transporter permease [Helicobacteraceae bacterium]|nr:ABC transporter permease [Helicobacteraceae bacterium]